MDYKKSKAPVNTVTRNIMDLCEETGNIYVSVAIIAKRANQISVEIKHYEKLPKPTLLATEEFIEGNVYYRDPAQDNAPVQEQA